MYNMHYIPALCIITSFSNLTNWRKIYHLNAGIVGVSLIVVVMVVIYTHCTELCAADMDDIALRVQDYFAMHLCKIIPSSMHGPVMLLMDVAKQKPMIII